MKRIFPTLIQVGMFLLVLELGSRALLCLTPITKEISKNDCDVTSRWYWVKDQRFPKPASRRFDVDRYDPTKGWVLIPNLKDKLCFRNKFINTNSRGIRGNAEYQYARDNGKLRILFLGDSFTFGLEVSDNETYPSYLQQMQPDAEVINMGVQGYGHDQMLIYLKEEGIKYRPDIIILGYLSMDKDRNMREFSFRAKPRFKLDNNQLKVCNVPVPSPAMILKEEPWRSRFLDLVDILMYEISLKDGVYASSRELITDAILRQIVDTAKGIGAVPLFLYLDDVRSKDPDQGITEEEKSFLARCQKVPVPCIFTRQEVYAARLKGVKIKESDHFGPETNRLIALGIKDYLLKNGLLGVRRTVMMKN